MLKIDTAQFLDIFIEESNEHLETLYEQLLLLEKEPENSVIIDEIFRAAHTIKGMSATMGYESIATLTHHLENIFDGIREDIIFVQPVVIDYTIKALDDLSEMIKDIANGGQGQHDITEIVHNLTKIQDGDLQLAEETKNEEVRVNNLMTKGLELDVFQVTILEESKELGFSNYEIYVALDEECLLKGARAYMVFETLEKLGDVIYTNPPVSELDEENFDLSFTIIFVTKESEAAITARIHQIMDIDIVKATPFYIETYMENVHNKSLIENVIKPIKKDAIIQTDTQTDTQTYATSKTIRVNIERLDKIMNLFEELVIDRGRLEQISTEVQHPELDDTVERMARLSTDLQSILLTMRMVPIENVFNRFPRMVRQLARELDKSIEVEIIGAETELDRTVIDEIADPLVHLIRNAIDHGIETPEARALKNKSRSGKISLKAYHSGNFVFVEITDDGAGINPEVIKDIAINKNLLSKTEADTLTEQQIYELMLSSGFSTIDVVSDVSGRGVGLDVVNKAVETLGGSLEIESEMDVGTTFSVQLPLTLSIISALLVELGDEKYAIPLSSIIETINLNKKDVIKAHNYEVIDFRGKLIPLAYLKEIFDVPEPKPKPETRENKRKRKRAENFISVVVIRRGDKVTGIVVDDLIGQQEIVLKSLGDYISTTFAISGATILGDGGVALVVDSNALIK